MDFFAPWTMFSNSISYNHLRTKIFFVFTFTTKWYMMKNLQTKKKERKMKQTLFRV